LKEDEAVMIEIPAWVVALPLVFALLGALAILTWAPFERRVRYLLFILAGVVLYFLATIPLRDDPRPPAVSVSGPGVPV
jgi:hypothetical protein